ncbi:MAG TPA: polyphosphate kinase 1 [bacterium]|nr:polyphosphate kinase 1 [bacterium]
MTEAANPAPGIPTRLVRTDADEERASAPTSSADPEPATAEPPPAETPAPDAAPAPAAPAAPAEIPLSDPSLYINRELSLLEFHERVLAQAKDSANPLLERLRFLTICSSILDEFFEIRVGALKEQLALGVPKTGPDGMGAQDTLKKVRGVVLRILTEQYRVLNEELLPQLRDEGVVLYQHTELDPEQRAWVREYFRQEVLPVLTPIGLDPAHPFPRILNKSLNFIVSLDGKDAFGRRSRAAVIQAPRILPRIIALPNALTDGKRGYVLLTGVMQECVGDVFPNRRVHGCHQFRVTRNSDLWIDEEEIQDLLLAVKGELPRRHFGNAVRLEVSANCPDDMVGFLRERFGLEREDVYPVDGPVNQHRLEALYDLVDRPRLKYPPFVPGLPKRLTKQSDMFAILRDRDILLHHPYQSFSPVLQLLRQAAADPDVLAVKLVVYRTGVDSPVGEALLAAANAGKEVTAVIELLARFDEAANVELASRLQEAGAKVVYGIVGFKAHAKMLLIVRRENGRLRRYVHVGTGNYNSRTTRQYTDFAFLTSDEEYGSDVHDLFQQLTSLGRNGPLKQLVQTPFDLHRRLLELIEQEEQNAREGKKSRIMAKMNALIEPQIIQALYRASQAGVSIDLIVRGICCLRPGIPGVSENIRVRSIVGRFLEHHRVFHFHAGGEKVTLCASADWMPRNFFRRVEAAFPVKGKKARLRLVREGLRCFLKDTCLAWEMLPDGSYRRLRPAEGGCFSAQEFLLETLASRPH